MALTNAYATLPDLKTFLGISDGRDDIKLEMSLNAASRQIDGHCGRRFWQDGSVVAREFFADDSTCCEVDDISTTTGLIVKVDDADTGAFGTTLTLTTNFILLPTNAADAVPVRPFTELRIVDTSGSWFPTSSSGRPGVQVTAKFGWPAVPDVVKQAAIAQASMLFKADAAVFGGVSFGMDGGVLRLTSRLHPMAEALLEDVSRPRVA